MDLATLDIAKACEEVFDFELVHFKTKEPLGLFFQILGYQSEPMRALTAKQDNKQRQREFHLQRGKEVEPTSTEEDNESVVEMVVTATVGWYERKRDKDGKLGKKIEGLPFGETRLTFSKEEARKLYSNPGFSWIGAQVVKAVYDVGNFMKG